MTSTLQLGGTRSSYRWQEMPGNWDRLNTRAIYPSTNQWGIPDLTTNNDYPDTLVAYSDRNACSKAAAADGQAAVHFFLDDYRFETIWTKPERGISRCQAVGMALTPDFSIWRDMPPVMQQWQVYRSRWCGMWMKQHHIDVIPTIGWGAPNSYSFAFAGIQKQSVVAISTVGLLRDKESLGFFNDGFEAMMYVLNPVLVLVYGHKVPILDGYPVRMYPTRWKDR